MVDIEWSMKVSFHRDRMDRKKQTIWTGTTRKEKLCFFPLEYTAEAFSDDLSKGREHDIDVHPYIPVLQVVDIPLHSFAQFPLFVDLTNIPLDLSHPGHPRCGFMAKVVIRNQPGIIICMKQHMGARADNAHVTHKHIKELRRFV